MKLIVGLGNPGSEYQHTRHNAGFIAIDKLVNHYGYDKKSQAFESDLFTSRINNEKIIFVKPLTYMNRSGHSVQQIVNYYKVPVKEILIIHDEKDLPHWRIHLKDGGGAAGHNGLKSIIEALQTNEFKRLRIGINRPQHGEDLASYVLHPLSQKEKIALDSNLDKVKSFLSDWVQSNSFEFIMNRYNPMFNPKS